MYKNNKLSIFSIAISLVIMSFNVAAKDNSYGFYLGASAGVHDSDEVRPTITSAGASFDKDDNASNYKVFFGKALNKVFTIEGHYLEAKTGNVTGNDTGSFSLSDTVTYDFTENDSTAKHSIKSTGLAFLFKPPVHINAPVKPFLKLGAHEWESIVDIDKGDRQPRRAKGTDMFYGLGIYGLISDNFVARLELENYSIDDDNMFNSSIGIHYNF